MKFLKTILKEIWLFWKMCWFLAILLGAAFCLYLWNPNRNEIILWCSLSYISSFVFYTFTIYLPERKSRKNIHRVIVPYLQAILSDSKGIFYSLMTAANHICDVNKLTEKDFHEVFKHINPSDHSPRLDYLGFGNWFEYLEHQKIRIRRTMDKILTYEHYLETDFILVIENIHNSTFFEILDFIEHKPVAYKDFDFLADAYFQCYRQVVTLEDYLKKFIEDF